MMQKIRDLSSQPGRKRKVQEEVSVSAATRARADEKIRTETQISR